MFVCESIDDKAQHMPFFKQVVGWPDYILTGWLDKLADCLSRVVAF